MTLKTRRYGRILKSVVDPPRPEPARLDESELAQYQRARLSERAEKTFD